MADQIQIDENKLPNDEGFKILGPDLLSTNVYLSRVTSQIEKGLSHAEQYPEFLEAFQMDLLLFFTVASEEMKDGCKQKMVELIVDDSIISSESYNEMSIIDGWSERQFWDLCHHFELEIVVESPGEKSIGEIIQLRNKLVHRPGGFYHDPPPPAELVSYINSTFDIIETLEES